VANIDLQNTELTVPTQKTGSVRILPIAKPLLQQSESLAAGDPKASVHLLYNEYPLTTPAM
jgi:hypothetical protein